MNNNTVEEVWKNILGYDGLYMVSNYGHILSCRQNKIMKPRISKGYLLVNLKKGGKPKSYSVHRIVAKHFIENPYNKPEINHLDENKLNNHVSNLRWATSKENSNWGTRNRKISEYVKANPIQRPENIGTRIKQVCISTGETIETFDTVKDANHKTGIHQPNISSCITGKKKTAGGYRWERIN